MHSNYTEPEKNFIRSAVLSHAVSSLTSSRVESSIVSETYCMSMLDYMFESFEKVGQKDLRSAMQVAIEHWLAYRQSKVLHKKAVDLQVLILCGPNPENDVLELLKLGISPWNIWAVEGEPRIFDQALASLREADFPCKIHRGSLHEFLSIVPQQFDIVYFDACGPLLGGSPPTWTALRELFLNQRLTHLSALITNFSSPMMDTARLPQWTDRLAAWFAPSPEQPVDFADEFSIWFSEFTGKSDGGMYVKHVGDNLEEYYSEFVSTFISRFASTLCPWWRAVSFPAAQKQLFSGPTQQAIGVARTLNAPEFDPSGLNLEQYGMAYLCPEMYPFLHVSALAKNLPSGDPLRRVFFDDELRGKKLHEVAGTMSIIRNAFDNLPASLELCAEEFSKALLGFRWFDSNGNNLQGLFCDIPFPNLLADLCLGQLGYPYHMNAKMHKRYRYQAKTTPMFTDVFVFDQARYLYDLVPNVSLLNKELPDSIQIFMRLCLDAIRKHAFTEFDPFKWSCLYGNSSSFPYYKLPERERI